MLDPYPKCRTCGDSFEAPERPCPKPSPGRPYVDTGRGGHVFDVTGDENIFGNVVAEALRRTWEIYQGTA